MVYEAQIYSAKARWQHVADPNAAKDRIQHLQAKAIGILSAEGYVESEQSLGGRTFEKDNALGQKDYAIFYDRHAASGISLIESDEFRHISLSDFIREKEPSAWNKGVSFVKQKLGFGQNT